MFSYRHVAFVLMLLIPTISFGAVSRLSFTNEPLSVVTGELSTQLTVQLQNSSGESESTTETMDVVFTSSSATGEFLNGSGNAVTKTMSIGTANKNFYYRDSKSGTYTLTVSVTSRISRAVFTTTQNIVVGTNGVPPTGDETSTSTGSILGASTASTNQTSYGGYISAGTEEQTSDFSIQIGKARDAVVDVPVYFNADISPVSKNNLSSFSWSFGDGTVAYGPSVHHSYPYPGRYVLVVRAQIGREFATTRVIVNVTSLDLEINDVKPGADGYISIKNLSNHEISLSNFAVNRGPQWFNLPQDMLILPNSFVRLASRISGIQATPGDIIELRNPFGNVLHSMFLSNKLQANGTSEEIIVKGGTIPDVRLIEMSNDLVKLEQSVRSLAINVVPQREIKLLDKDQSIVKEKANSKVKVVSQAIVIERKSSLFKKLFTLPRSLINAVLAMF